MFKLLISCFVRQWDFWHLIILKSEFLFYPTFFFGEDHVETISWEIISNAVGTPRKNLIIDVFLFDFLVLIP